MKTYYKYIALLLVIALAGSCRDEEGYPIPDVTTSTIPVFLQGDDDTGFVDFQDLNNTNLSFDVNTLGKVAVTSIDVLITFNNGETGQSQTVTYTTVTSIPQRIELSFAQLLDQFPDEVVTADTLSLGDSFVVGGNVLLADGRYLSGGYSPSVVANDPVFLTYNVACASSLAGTYDFTIVSGPNGEATSLPNQTITQLAPGYYEISDLTMDLFGPDFPMKYRFTDICSTLIADPAAVDYPTLIFIKMNPDTSIDPVTGVITFSIEYLSTTCCGAAGLKTVFKATPK